MARTSNSADRELAAISSILQALDGLDGESIQRVLDYVFDRLSIPASRHAKGAAPIISHTAITAEATRIRRPRVCLQLSRIIAEAS